MSSRAVQGVNDWNLYQNDGDVICTAGTPHESQRKIRNNTVINTDTNRSFTSRNYCGSLFLSATWLQMSLSSNASPHEQPQNTEATKRVTRKSLPNTFETSQGLDPSGEKLHNKINSFCQESQDSGRKLTVPVVATEEKAVSLGRTVKSDSIFASPPRPLPSLLNVSDNSVCPSWCSGPKLPLWTVSGYTQSVQSHWTEFWQLYVARDNNLSAPEKPHFLFWPHFTAELCVLSLEERPPLSLL